MASVVGENVEGSGVENIKGVAAGSSAW